MKSNEFFFLLGIENSSTSLIKDKKKTVTCDAIAFCAALLTQKCSTCWRIIKRITLPAGKSFGLVILLGYMQLGLSKDDLLKI